MIRVATSDDVEHLMGVARHCYSAHPYDESACRAWLEHTIHNESAIVLCSDHGGIIAGITKLFYKPAPMCFLMFLAATPNHTMDGYRLLRAMIECARSRGAAEVHFGSDTGVDFAPFAKRFGLERGAPSYVLRL